MSQDPPESLQELIQKRRDIDDEYSKRDLIQIYSRCVERLESKVDAGEVQKSGENGMRELRGEEIREHAVRLVRSILIAYSADSSPSDWGVNIEEEKGKLGEQLKNRFDLQELDEVPRWVKSCDECGYIKISPGKTVLSRIFCRKCKKRLWIDPHPDEVPEEDVDPRTVKRLEESKRFI